MPDIEFSTPESHGTKSFPDGFELMPSFGDFHELAGPFYMRKSDSGWVVAFRVEEKHRNRNGGLHGGMLCMLADTALVYATGHSATPRLKVLTTSLTVQLALGAQVGDWVEASVDLVRVGRRVGFPTCMICCGGKRIGHASGTFQIMGQHEQ